MVSLIDTFTVVTKQHAEVSAKTRTSTKITITTLQVSLIIGKVICTGLSKRNCVKLRESFCPAAASHSRPRQAGAQQNSSFFCTSLQVCSQFSQLLGPPDIHLRQMARARKRSQSKKRQVFLSPAIPCCARTISDPAGVLTSQPPPIFIRMPLKKLLFDMSIMLQPPHRIASVYYLQLLRRVTTTYPALY